jgi:SAM-dependent methyltransferase
MKDFWNQRFKEEGFAYGLNPNDFLKDNINVFKKHGDLLCIAEGEGRNAIFLAQNHFQVTTVDQSEVGIEKTLLRAKNLNLAVTGITSDLADFDFGENRWDGIISIFGHLPPDLRKEVHQKIFKSLKSGGKFLFEAYTPRQLEFNTGGPKDINMMITEEIIQKELGDFTILFLNNTIRDIQEGKYHHGLSSVIQFIGEKK